MRGSLLTVCSIVLTGLVIGNAYYQKKQFFPSVVYIAKSNPSLAVLYLQAFVFVILLGQLTRKVFFGQLRPAETEHLIERSWYAVTETCLAFTVFRDNFSPIFVAQFTMLLFLKCFHWLSEDRIEYMERSPIITIFFHLRALGIFILLGTLDSIFIHEAYNSVLKSGASTQLVFGFEYAILLTIVVAVFTKYILHTIDLQSENPWENKAVYILYSELVMGFFKSLLYVLFMVIMIRVHTFPLFAIRPMYLTLRSFKKSVNDVIMSRRAILNMNTLYPDATEEELAGDNVCIICREEMQNNCKKLPCNHIFHTSCLRSWFQRQQTCPTCRLDVLVPPPRTTIVNPPVPGPPGQGGFVMQPPFHMFPMGFPQGPNVHGIPGFPPVAGAGAPPPGVLPQPAGAAPLPGGVVPPPAAGIPHPPQGPTPPTGIPQGASTSTAGAGSSSMGSAPNIFPPFMPPFPMFPPPMFGMAFPPGSQSSVPNLSTLSTEQLQEMEGVERRNVEARIEVLRNIHSLLDTAITQLNQYSQIIATQSSFVPPPTPLTNSTANVPETSPTRDNPASGKDTVVTGVSVADVPGPSWAVPKDNGLVSDAAATTTPGDEETTSQLIPAADLEDDGLDSGDVRRRRLERFASASETDKTD